MSEAVKSRPGVSDRLRAQGYAVFDVGLLQDGDADYYFGKNLSQLGMDCQDLPEDAGCEAGTTFRRRGRFIQLPGRAAPMAFGEDWEQDISPEFTYEPRLAPLTRAQRESFSLQRLILRGCRVAERLGREAPVEVSVEIFRSEPGRGSPAPALPASTLAARPAFRMVALVSRAGIVGGEALVTSPPAAAIAPRFLNRGAIRDRLTLTEPWQGAIVDTRTNALYLSPVRLADGSHRGQQTLLIVDYTRLTPEMPR